MIDWGELSASEKAEFMRICISNGIRDLGAIRELYENNEYRGGGEEEHKDRRHGIFNREKVRDRVLPVITTGKKPITILKEAYRQYRDPNSSSEKFIDNMQANVDEIKARGERYEGELSEAEGDLLMTKQHEDAKRIYLGYDPKYGTMEPSQYRPTIGKSENPYQVNPLLSDTAFEWAVYPAWAQWKTGAPGYTIKDNGKTALVKDFPYLSDATLSEGHDEKGHYISLYDIWDYNASISSKPGDNIGKWIGGKPFEIYQRYYLDDWLDIPKEHHGNHFLAPAIITGYTNDYDEDFKNGGNLYGGGGEIRQGKPYEIETNPEDYVEGALDEQLRNVQYHEKRLNFMKNYSEEVKKLNKRYEKLLTKLLDLRSENEAHLKPGITEKEVYMAGNDYKSAETILRKYDAFPKQYKKLFKDADVRTITDSNGNTWYEVDVPKDYLKKEWVYSTIPVGIGLGASINNASAQNNKNSYENGGPLGDKDTLSHPKYNASSEKAIYDYLARSGLNDAQTSGIMGNLAVESLLNSNINQFNGPAYGLIQAEGARKNALKSYQGNPYIFGSGLLPEEQKQLDYIIDVGINNYTPGEWGKQGYSGARAARKAFIDSSNIDEASDIFMRNYLRPGKPHQDRRRKMSNYYFNKYNKNNFIINDSEWSLQNVLMK